MPFEVYVIKCDLRGVHKRMEDYYLGFRVGKKVKWFEPGQET